MSTPLHSGTGTPRTDAVAYDIYNTNDGSPSVTELSRDGEHSPADHARQLETELTAARAEVDSLNKDKEESIVRLGMAAKQCAIFNGQLQAKEQELAEARDVLGYGKTVNVAHACGDRMRELAARDATIAGLRDAFTVIAELREKWGKWSEHDIREEMEEIAGKALSQVTPPKPDAP